MYTSTITTPQGPFTLIATDDAVLASGWTEDAERLRGLIGRALRPRADALVAKRDLGDVTRAVAAYYDGDVTALDAVPVAQATTPFLARAREELRAIPAGAPETYTQLAARAGNANAIRAAGTACARNPIALIVPCHRVFRADGTLGGFAYGLERKRWLLDFEAERGAAAGDATTAGRPRVAVAA